MRIMCPSPNRGQPIQGASLASEASILAQDHPLLSLTHTWSVTSLRAQCQPQNTAACSSIMIICLPACDHEPLLPICAHEVADRTSIKTQAPLLYTYHYHTQPLPLTTTAAMTAASASPRLLPGTFAGAHHAQQLLGAPRASQARASDSERGEVYASPSTSLPVLPLQASCLQGGCIFALLL